jgi:ribonuclease P protein component
MGGAVVRNRIKRRLRAAVRQHLAGLRTSADIVINPKRTTAAADFTQLTIEVQRAFGQIQRRVQTSSEAAKPAEVHKGSPA